MPPNSVLGDVETDHSHCAQCIVLKRCSYLTQKRDATCPVVSCKFDCAAKFHECQLDEHLLLCSNYSVPCLNRYYGCPFVLPRRQMSAHLPRCPASVVHCSAEWNRWPAHTREKPHYQNPHLISSNADQLEIALALRDQRALKELWDAPRETRRAFRNNLTKKYPAVPLKPYQGRLKVRDSRSSTSSPTVINTQTTTTDDESESSPWTKTYPGLQKSICEKLADYNNDTKLDDAKKLSLEECKAQSNDIPPAPHQVALSLDISIDTIAPYQPKPRQMYTFRCAKELRRDEFGDHYKNVHSDIHGSVNGWMEYRCPLWQYGCSFTRRRLYPKPVGSKIVYHSAIESLGHSVLPDDAGCQQLTSHLPSLPSELIRHLCLYLDGFSLTNLSMVSKRLRTICSSVLDNRGLVTLEWEKSKNFEGRSEWKIVGRTWTFSTGFSAVRDWYLGEDVDILNHLAHCSHYEKVIRTEPFELPKFK